MPYYAAAPGCHRTQTLHFGVELELLVSSRGKTHKTWHALAAEVSAALSRAGVANHVRDAGAFEDYTEWSIVQEVTIPSGKGVCKFLYLCASYPRWAASVGSAHIMPTRTPTPHRDLATEMASVSFG